MSKQMSLLKKDDLIFDKAADIKNHVLDYYERLFASENVCVDNGLVEKVILDIVSKKDNDMLSKLPTHEEVKAAIFSMNGNGSPGPDGFSGCFFQKFWDIVVLDVFNAVRQIFAQDWLLPGLNSNLVYLIPKFKVADRIENFRPIALTNFQSKIITKVLTDILASIAPKIISENQRGFIEGRQISDCVCITSEAINMLENKAYGGNLALEVDIKKAFDTLDWNFLL